MIWFVMLAAIAAGICFALAWLRRGVERTRRAKEEARRAILAFRTGQAAIASELSRAAVDAVLADGEPVLVRDADSGELLALAATATAEHGESTAVLAWRRERWRSEGRVVPGLSPAETLRRHRSRLIAA